MINLLIPCSTLTSLTRDHDYGVNINVTGEISAAGIKVDVNGGKLKRQGLLVSFYDKTLRTKCVIFKVIDRTKQHGKFQPLK